MYKGLNKYLPVLNLAMAILIFLMIFFPAITSDGSEILKGTEATFGLEISRLFDLGSVSITFNFWNFMAFLFPIILTFTSFQVRKASSSAQETEVLSLLVKILSLGAFILAFVCFLNFGENTKGVITGVVEMEYNFSWFDHGIGVILATAFSSIGIVSSAINLFLHIKKYYI